MVTMVVSKPDTWGTVNFCITTPPEKPRGMRFVCGQHNRDNATVLSVVERIHKAQNVRISDRQRIAEHRKSSC
jgi:hypothetical protein